MELLLVLTRGTTTLSILSIFRRFRVRREGAGPLRPESEDGPLFGENWWT